MAMVLGARRPWSGKKAWRRRSAAPWLDSWYGDEEEDAAELVVLSDLHGEVSTGGELPRRRRPCFGAEEEREGKEERAGGNEEKQRQERVVGGLLVDVSTEGGGAAREGQGEIDTAVRRGSESPVAT